jgi:hypothetical protein
MDLIESTSSTTSKGETIEISPRPNAHQIGIALRALGAKKVVISDSLVTATHHGVTVNIRLCRENIPFVWWTGEDGEQHFGYSVRDARKALGLTGYVRPATVIIRALKEFGMTNRRGESHLSRDFFVHGAYASSGERIKTIVDFYSQEAERKIVEIWDELKPALDLTDYTWRKHETKVGDGRSFPYLTN